MSVYKQLCVNQLEIPEELLDIIKSYAFDDIIRYRTKMRKKTIHTLIQCTPWSYRTKKYDRYMFWIEEDRKCRQYQMNFCSKCGNYSARHTIHNYDKIDCKCYV